MNRPDRIALEEQLLRRHFGPTFKVQGTRGPSHGVVGRLSTNSGGTYTLFLPLTGFPDNPPQAFIVDPVLRCRSGDLLPELSHRMHTRNRNEHDHTQVCHYTDDSWSSSVTLYKVVLKVRIWLEAYERYLATGQTIAAFLSPMSN